MRRRFWVALAFTIPVTLMAGHIPGLPMLVQPPLARWLELVLSMPVVWWAGWIFIGGSYYALRSRKLDMSVLIATGVLAAWLSQRLPHRDRLSDGLLRGRRMLVTFVLFGHWMEMKSRRGHVRRPARPVRPGAPDGTGAPRTARRSRCRRARSSSATSSGSARATRSRWMASSRRAAPTSTRRSSPARAGRSSAARAIRMVGGAINVSGAVTMRATRVGKDTVLAQIAALVARGAELEGAAAAAGRPGGGGARRRRGRRRRPHLSRMDRTRRRPLPHGADLLDLRRGHRLSRRAGPGHPDRRRGRHRPRRTAQHPDQGRRDARRAEPHPDRRAGQDRHASPRASRV